MDNHNGDYIGDELDFFRHAENWKNYFSRSIQRFIGRRVLEVGAGIGETTKALCRDDIREWTCLEPDENFCSRIQEQIAAGQLPGCCTVEKGTLASVSAAGGYDSVLYIDVLEHIEDDEGELQRAAARLDRGGYIVVLSPAHQYLYSPFDREIGHFRRYNLSSLKRLCPEGMQTASAFYLDSAGWLASAANRFLLRQSMPTLQQVLFWDRVIVPVSRILDVLTCRRMGKSVVVIFEKQGSAS